MVAQQLYEHGAANFVSMTPADQQGFMGFVAAHDAPMQACLAAANCTCPQLVAFSDLFGETCLQGPNADAGVQRVCQHLIGGPEPTVPAVVPEVPAVVPEVTAPTFAQKSQRLFAKRN